MTRVLLSLTLMLFSLSASAETREDPLLRNELAFGFHHKQGNSDDLGTNVEGKRVDLFDDSELITKGAFSYSESDDQKKTEKAKIDSVYSIPVSERLYVAFGVEWSYDDIADVHYRTIVGPPSLGYRVYTTEKATLIGELGGGYLWEDVGGVKSDAPVIQLSEKAELKLSDTAKTWQSVEYLPEAEDFDIYLLNAEAGIQSSINTHLALKLVAKNTFDSQPADDRQRNDVQTHASLVVSF